MVEKEEILKITIPSSVNEDLFIWLGCKDGKYTVKFGYHVAKEKEENRRARDPGSSYVIPKSLRKCIWKVVVPTKIQNFLWRIGSGALATNEALARRFGGRDPMCPVCGEEKETLKHLLFLCSWANKCWHGSELYVKLKNLLLTYASFLAFYEKKHG